MHIFKAVLFKDASAEDHYGCVIKKNVVLFRFMPIYG